MKKWYLPQTDQERAIGLHSYVKIERRAGDRDRPMQLFRLRNMAARRVVRRGNVVRSWQEFNFPLPSGYGLVGDWYMLYRQAVTLYSRLVTLTR